MKKIQIIGLTMLTILIISCRKKDIQPVISLNGAYEQTLPLNGTYFESGATAKDNRDGDISDKIVISGSVDNNKTGEYRLFYNVQDQEGNKAATATRFVNVVNSADFMIGTYEATPTCTGTMTAENYHTTITTSTSSNNEIYIKKIMYGVEDQPVLGKISGDIVNIPTQLIGTRTISGSGTISSGNIILDVDISGPGAYDCSINHVKL